MNEREQFEKWIMKETSLPLIIKHGISKKDIDICATWRL